MKDSIIVGGGPAGLTAALYLARFLRDVVVIDAREGRAGLIPKTHNLAPFPAGITGQDLLGQMRSHAEKYGAELAVGTVHEIARKDGAFHVATDRHNVAARSVLLATGVVNHRPPLPAKDHDLGCRAG